VAEEVMILTGQNKYPQPWFLLFLHSETSIYRSRLTRFLGSIIQFLWSLSESYLNYGSRIYCFPGSIVSLSDPRRKRWIEVPLYNSYLSWSSNWTLWNFILRTEYCTKKLVQVVIHRHS
jgi:hypothetical protein